MTNTTRTITAEFKVLKTGKHVQLVGTILGGMYLNWLDPSGHTEGTTHVSDWTYKFMEELVKTKELRLVSCKYSSLYHVWHICYCPKCAPIGGRSFDHSQGMWNEHLRYSDQVYTFPTRDDTCP